MDIPPPPTVDICTRGTGRLCYPSELHPRGKLWHFLVGLSLRSLAWPLPYQHHTITQNFAHPGLHYLHRYGNNVIFTIKKLKMYHICEKYTIKEKYGALDLSPSMMFEMLPWAHYIVGTWLSSWQQKYSKKKKKQGCQVQWPTQPQGPNKAKIG